MGEITYWNTPAKYPRGKGKMINVKRSENVVKESEETFK